MSDQFSPKEIRGLLEQLNVSQDEIDKLYEMKVRSAMMRAFVMSVILSKGGNMHRFNAAKVAKWRAQNKAARAARRINRR